MEPLPWRREIFPLFPLFLLFRGGGAGRGG